MELVNARTALNMMGFQAEIAQGMRVVMGRDQGGCGRHRCGARSGRLRPAGRAVGADDSRLVGVLLMARYDLCLLVAYAVALALAPALQAFFGA